MRTKLVGKRLVSMLLTLLMLLSMLSISVFADDTMTGDDGYVLDNGSIAGLTYCLAKEDYKYGGNVSDCKAFLKSVAAQDSIKSEYAILDPDFEPTADTKLSANKQYYLQITGEVKEEGTSLVAGFAPATAIKLEYGALGDTEGWTELSVVAEKSEMLDQQIGKFKVVFQLPLLTNNSEFVVPFTKVVKEGGNVTPGRGNFELEVLNVAVGSNNPVDLLEFDRLTFETNGSGNDFERYFTIKCDDYDKVTDLLDEGLVVREKNSGVAYWTYSDEIWIVKLHHDTAVNALTDDEVQPIELKLDFYRAEPKPDGNYVTVGEPETKMSFTNIYTDYVYEEEEEEDEDEPKRPEKPKKEEKVEKPVEKPVPETGDDSMVGLSVALMCLSGMGLVVAGKKGKK